MRCLKTILFPCLLLSLLAIPHVLSAKPLSPETIEVYLITVGHGPDIQMRYGHTMLQLEDTDTKRLYNFNWGTFDFEDPFLPLNFFLGKLHYWLSVWSQSERELKDATFGKRSILRQKIHLSLPQKTVLLKELSKNLEGENIYFWYHFFFKNCSTLPRDLLDQVSGGALKKALQMPAGTTFRYYVRDYLSSPLGVSFLLDIYMNDTIDYPISKWEESFYPIKLSEHFAHLASYDMAGNEIPGQRFMDPVEMLYPGFDFPPAPLRIPHVLGVLGLLLLALAWFGKGLSLHRWVSSFWLFFTGISGWVMLLAWIFSEHDVLKHNANLWLFWPTDLFAIGFLWVSVNRFKRYAQIHFGALLLAGSLWLCGLISQDMGYVFLYAIPFSLYLMVSPCSKT